MDEVRLLRVGAHPIIEYEQRPVVTISVDGRPITAHEGEPIAAALLANGIITLRHTAKRAEPRGLFCGIGVCSDCKVTVDGVPNVRACITPVRAGMAITTQRGAGTWPTP